MKKVLTLICAVALVAGANAQVKQVRNVGEPLSKGVAKMESTVSPLMMTPVKGAVKADNEDTIHAEAPYHQEGGSFGGGFTVTGIRSFDDINKQTAVWWPLGTGWVNEFYGSGEIGYTFNFSLSGFYSMMGLDMSAKGITGVLTYVFRARSIDPSINERDMPLYFKLYTSALNQIENQDAWDDMTTNEGQEDVLEANFPGDPEKYAALSHVVGVPYIPGKDESDLDGDIFGAQFINPPATVGDFACVSVMFPNEKDGTDTLWNATMLYYCVGNGNTNALMSDDDAPVYAVWDFDHQQMWGQRNDDNSFTYARERPSWFLPESAADAQPNTRYGITARKSWYFYDQSGNRTGSRMNQEPIMRIIIADNVTIERGAAYDKYVEVKTNPAIDHTVLQATDKIKNVEIYSLNGKLVKTQACNSHIETISLQGLTSGMYIAKVTTEGGIANKKIMVR